MTRADLQLVPRKWVGDILPRVVDQLPAEVAAALRPVIEKPMPAPASKPKRAA